MKSGWSGSIRKRARPRAARAAIHRLAEVFHELIRQTGQVLVGAVRTHDFVARLGGDEFGVLAIRTDGDGLDQLRRRLVRTLSRMTRSRA